MTLRIGPQSVTLALQRNLGTTTERLAQSFERLSTGQRINRASDDAAGLAVASATETEARIRNRGRKNANDAISLLSVADAALGEISNILQRQSELAEQAANGTMNLDQRRAVNEEYWALGQELRRVADATTFNGIPLLAPEELDLRSSELLWNGAPFNEGYVYRMDPTGRWSYVSFGIPFANGFSIYDSETGTSAAYDIPTIAGFGTGGAFLDISANGDALVSVSEAGKNTLVSYNLLTHEKRVLTTSQSASDILYARFSADAATVAFTSRTTYTDGGSALSPTGTAASTRIYTLNLETGIVRGNNTDIAGVVSAIRVSSDGSQVAYRKSTGEVGYFNTDSSTTSAFQTVIASGATSIFAISNEGDVIIESSSNLAGTGVFTEQLYSKNGSTLAVQQLTNVTGGLNTQQGTLSADGTRIYFNSNRNITGENSGLKQNVFELHIASGEIEQKTDLNFSAADDFFVSADGRTVIFQVSSEDLYLQDLRPQTRQINFEVGYGASGNISANLQAVQEFIYGVGQTTLTSQTSAGLALTTTRENLDRLNLTRGELGATQSRLGFTTTLLASEEEELLAATSRIRDIDVASEAANLLRLQILQQAQTALLAQSKKDSQLILKLLEST